MSNNTIKYDMKSIAYQDASVWNHFPFPIKEVDEYANFRQLLRNSNYWNNCQCGSCFLYKITCNFTKNIICNFSYHL